MTDSNNTTPLNESDAAALIAAIEANCNRQGRIVDIGDGRKAAILADGESLHDIKDELAKYLPKPERLTGETAMHDLASFLNECERFKGDGSALTVYVAATDPAKRPSIVGVFNDSKPGAPDYRDHRSTYAPAASHEILAWVKAGEKLMSQEDFAELIEARLLDVKKADPKEHNAAPLFEAAQALGLHVGTPAELLEVSRGLQVNVGAVMEGRANLQNGSVTFAFKESVQPQVVVPGAVILEVPFFEGAAKVLILARVRYKVISGAITWRVLLHDLARVYSEAVDDVCRDIREAGHRVVLGQP